MNTIVAEKAFAARCVAAAAVMSLCATILASEAAPAPESAPARPRAVFVNDPQNGKDPFFPESTRRLQALVRVKSETARPVVADYDLSLKGISGSKLQPLALINTTTVAVGEDAEVRCGRGPVKIRCREIREKSVLIEIEGTGEVRELRLREGI